MRSLKEIIRYNPRSTSNIRDGLFLKTSPELSLANEAKELKRCKELSISTSHVSPLDLMDFDTQKNQLTTKLVPNGVSLYNFLWNGTSLFRFMRKERLDSGLVLARMGEIGRWLKLYHDSTADAGHCGEALENFKRLYCEKIEAIRNFDILEEKCLERIEECFVPQIEKAADATYQKDNFIRFGRIQGDFAVGNMLVDANCHIYITDFADSRIGASLEDVVRFYEQLWAMSQTNGRRGSLLSQALEVFLNGYGAPRRIEETPFFKALIAYNGLISCITEYTTAPYIKYQIMTRFELKRLRNATLRWIYDEIGNKG